MTRRGEYRAGERADHAAATLAALGQLGDGEALGVLASWTRATPINGLAAESANVAASLALRPVGEAALLAKLEYRAEQANGLTGRRAVASMSGEWLPRGRNGRELGEFSLFLGGRYTFDRLDKLDVAGWSGMAGFDARVSVGSRVELGVTGTVRGDLQGSHRAFGYGPSIGVRPAKDMLVTVGWMCAVSTTATSPPRAPPAPDHPSPPS